jgi:hypothetical protein
MKKLAMTVLLLLGFAMPTAAHAQIAWDAPLLLPPRPGAGLGVYLVDASGGGLGVLGTWRPGDWSYGLRLGIAEAPGDDIGVYGGFDYVSPLHSSNASFPLDVGWLAGVGAGIDDDVRLSAPLGLTLGHTFNASGAAIVPNFAPRVVLDAWFGDDEGINEDDDSDVGLDVAVDLGVDIRFTRGGALAGKTIRFGATLGGDRDGLGIGIVF